LIDLKNVVLVVEDENFLAGSHSNVWVARNRLGYGLFCAGC
jgi:hypothetical protein